MYIIFWKKKKLIETENRESDYKQAQETLCSHGNAPYSDCDGGYVTIFTYQISCIVL